MDTQIATPSTQSTQTTQTTQTNTPPDWLPVKFWDAKTGQPRLKELAQSYRELERALGAAKELPEASEHEGSLNVRMPASPTDYQINVDENLEIDDEINQRLHATGFTNEQAQLVYDLAGERLLPMMQAMSEDQNTTKHMDRLTQHFGSVERVDALRPQLRSWGKANLDTPTFDTLSNSAEGVIAMHSMMQNHEPGLNRKASTTTGANEAELKSMMNDPRYWRDRDPAFVNKVRAGFKALYPEGAA